MKNMINKIIKPAAVLLIACVAFTGCDKESDVIGLNDAAKYGNIKVTLEGTQPDGEAYKVTKNFRFASSSAPATGSVVYTNKDGDVTYRDFYVTRFFGAINASYEGEGNLADFSLYVEEIDGETSFEGGDFYLQTSIVTDDKQFFYVSEYFNMDNVTGYKYNEESGKLSFKFTSSMEDNFSNELTLTAEVNVTVFRHLQGN